jgi:hypothetical protein
MLQVSRRQLSDCALVQPPNDVWAHKNARSSESESRFRGTTTNNIFRAKLHRLSLAPESTAYHRIVPSA